jgi:hypothetical protein
MDNKKNIQLSIKKKNYKATCMNKQVPIDWKNVFRDWEMKIPTFLQYSCAGECHKWKGLRQALTNQSHENVLKG